MVKEGEGNIPGVWHEGHPTNEILIICEPPFEGLPADSEIDPAEPLFEGRADGGVEYHHARLEAGPRWNETAQPPGQLGTGLQKHHGG